MTDNRSVNDRYLGILSRSFHARIEAVIGARHLRLRPVRVGPLVLRWLLQGTWLVLLLGIPALIAGAIVIAGLLIVLAVWPLALAGACLGLGLWAMRRGWLRPAGAGAPPPAPPAAVQPGDLPLLRPLYPLPPAVLERIDRIRQKAEALAGSAAGPEDRYLVQSTLDDYLPGAVEAYRSLPPGSGEWPVTADGRTGLRLLEDQLDLLDRNLDEIAGHAWRDGAQRLLAHQRFLEQRLGAGSTRDLDIPR